ncbi:MAG: FadR family transcriptional regulator [Rubrivivax sp.]|nr:FadR family transcriptional regulator [Rubrivivax sp.]MBK8525946.1 FadR family transcriptional regulator [Rubrivivax sp.]
MSRRTAAGAPRSLALQLVDVLVERIRSGQLTAGTQLPTESALMAEQGVSRTAVREALSQLQASGQVETRHGIGTFVLADADSAAFRIRPQQRATLQDVVAVLELRIGVETEAAGLAAQRRTSRNLAVLRAALDDFERAVTQGGDAVAADFRFHSEIGRATQNTHFSGLMGMLGPRSIPRARLHPTKARASGGAAGPQDAAGDDEAHRAYLRHVNAEHESIFDAIARQDADAARAAMRTHLSNSRERRRRDFDVAS